MTTWTYPNNNITINASSTSASSIFVTSPSNGTSWSGATYAVNNPVPPSVKLSTKGIHMDEGTDLVIGNVSIKQSLEAIEHRLAMLRPNLELEAEWAELKRLGDEYRALEREIKDKMVTWDILKK